MKQDAIERLLTRRVHKILPTKEGLAKLLKQKKIRLYQGFDPTGARLHLGHSIGLRKLMEFANFGHEVIFLFGTGTVLVGDPSQRDSARTLITKEDIERNIKDWKQQASPLVDFSKVTIKQNGDWLCKLTLQDLIRIASNISAAQLFKREMFQRRMKRGDTIWYHETMYPLLQGYDSVAMDVDLELGGTDQEFNMLIGRDLQKKMQNRKKYVLILPMIMGTDGKQMSKTTGNCVWLNDNPADMFGKIMSMPDENIVPYLELVTSIPTEIIQEMKKALKNKTLHPKAAKEILAKEVVKDFHGEEHAHQVKEEFQKVFGAGRLPAELTEIKVQEREMLLVDLIVKLQLASSKAEARRLISQKGVKIDENIQDDWAEIVSIKKGIVVRVGKRKIVKIS